MALLLAFAPLVAQLRPGYFALDDSDLNERIESDYHHREDWREILPKSDLLSEEIRTKIQENGPYSLVVCDAAPLTTGNRTIDTARSKALVDMAIWYAQTMLKKGGNFCVKIFQNGDQQKELQKMREIFTTAKGFKPEACRSSSFETYLIGINKKI